MNILRDALHDLRDRKLWPVAAALVAALVAIPVLLSTSASGSGSPPAPPLAALPSTPVISGLPAVSVSTAPTTHSNLKGRGRDPFTQKHLKAAVAGASGSGSTGAAGTTTAGGTTASSTTTTTPATTSPPVTTTTTPATTTPPPPPGLTATESYNVSISITNSGGGLDRLDSVERLSVLPSQHRPLMIELGVLKGGHRVLFAVQPGAVVHGPGTCLPGRVDCQILSLGKGQIESVSASSNVGPGQIVPFTRTSNAGTASGTLFAVTAIKAQEHGSAAAAERLRKRASAAGRRLLNGARLSALSLFRYEPSLGAVVDLRNLSVGRG